MRETLFTAIYNKLLTVTNLKGSDGTIRIYKYPVALPEGFPAVSITCSKLESRILDNARDLRTYYFNVRIIQEKMVEAFGPEKAERVSREREDEILGVFDDDNDLSVAGVIRSTPVTVDWGYINANTQIVLDITIAVEVAVNITP